jgi:hypothetical protein
MAPKFKASNPYWTPMLSNGEIRRRLAAGGKWIRLSVPPGHLASDEAFYLDHRVEL